MAHTNELHRAAPDWPRITVVTPSFNQGHFIEETITSVISQGYPNLEYIVMDGGSTDNTVEIIKKYEKHISYWQSEKDGGQSAAINTAFRRSTGDILAWLNSDDFYLPGTLGFVAGKLDIGQAEVLLGNCFHFYQDSPKSLGSDIALHHANAHLRLWDYIAQPSSFWTRQTWEQTGELNEKLHFAFDWEWYIRAQNASARFTAHSRYLSAYRFHEAHKTGTGGEKRTQEIASIYQTYAGERYERLFNRFRRSVSRIVRVRHLIHLLKLSALENSLLRLAFPGIYREYSASEIHDIWSMCYGVPPAPTL